MNLHVSDLDIDLQLSIFAALMQKTPGLVAVREIGSGRLKYINETGTKMLGTDDFPSLELLLEQHQLGAGKVALGNAFLQDEAVLQERQWHNIQGETFTGLYEEMVFKHGKEQYCFFRISDSQSDRRYRLQLSKELQRFGALFNYASIGIIVANQEGNIILINDFALSQFDYRREELTGQKVEVLIPRRVHDKHIGHRERYNNAPQSRPMGIGLDLFAVRRDGSEFPVEISLSHYSNEEGHFVIAYISNITERKKAEERIERLNNELESMVEERTRQLVQALADLEASKEELTAALSKEKELGDLKSRFVSMASHEFRTPLSTILSSAFLVKHYAAEAEQPVRNKHIQRIVNAVSFLTDTLNDFLSVGKIEEGKLQARYSMFQINDYFQTIIQEMQGIIKESQTISYEHTGGDVCWLDTSLLRHIAMNLLGNAIKFSPPDSTIEMYTTMEDNLFTLMIKDYGIGMSQEDQQHLYERFYRGANVSNIQGTGLGLHIVQKYSELMNGAISCASELGKGTVFTITFPTDPINTP
ncbi:sensor histidine kinase [Chitinophaga qingshengii]|nr:PAS domain-containing sensor histidine kinase [Chitinophaga qingshengii]